LAKRKNSARKTSVCQKSKPVLGVSKSISLFSGPGC
jgi:hypothetical protein